MLKAVPVSIGSFNAACVVGAKTRDNARAQLDALWDDLTLEASAVLDGRGGKRSRLFRQPGFYTPRPDFRAAPTWTYVYDPRPLPRDAWNAMSTSLRIVRADVKFVVTAVEVVTGAIAAILQSTVSAAAPRSSRDHVLASGSLPPRYPERNRRALRSGTAACSTIPRSASPSTRSAPMRRSTGCWSSSIYIRCAPACRAILPRSRIACTS